VAYSNGNIPGSLLAPIPGSNAGLLKPAALTYKAMHYYSLKVTGTPLTIIDGQVGRTYRSYSRQLLAKQIYGSNAATPGFSNHGLALAVDLMYAAQRAAIDRVGRAFGWAKEWSDASWEWWHMKWRDVGWKPKPDPTAKLPRHMRKAANALLYRRKRRRSESHTGIGKLWHKWDRLVENSYAKVLALHNRADNQEYKRILWMVLSDRDGTL